MRKNAAPMIRTRMMNSNQSISDPLLKRTCPDLKFRQFFYAGLFRFFQVGNLLINRIQPACEICNIILPGQVPFLDIGFHVLFADHADLSMEEMRTSRFPTRFSIAILSAKRVLISVVIWERRYSSLWRSLSVKRSHSSMIAAKF